MAAECPLLPGMSLLLELIQLLRRVQLRGLLQLLLRRYNNMRSTVANLLWVISLNIVNSLRERK